MLLRDHIPAGALLPGLTHTTLDDTVAAATRALATAAAVGDADGLVRLMLSQGTGPDTVVGRGVAVPHVRTPQVADLSLAVASLAEPVAVAGAEAPVDLLFVIAAPDRDPRLMLRALARLGRLMKSPAFLPGLRRAGTPAALLAAFPER